MDVLDQNSGTFLMQQYNRHEGCGVVKTNPGIKLRHGAKNNDVDVKMTKQILDQYSRILIHMIIDYALYPVYSFM